MSARGFKFKQLWFGKEPNEADEWVLSTQTSPLTPEERSLQKKKNKAKSRMGELKNGIHKLEQEVITLKRQIAHAHGEIAKKNALIEKYKSEQKAASDNYYSADRNLQAELKKGLSS
jgi:predicted  nucleic acid-binding Zn-ribbon protein